MASYYEQFNNTIDMLEHCGASLGEDDDIITKVLEHHDIVPATATATQKENANRGPGVVLRAGLPDGS